MRMMAGSLAVAAMSVFGLTGCGDSTEEFCALQDEFETIGEGNASLNEARDAIDELQDTAPDEISEDVDIVANAFHDYLDALEEAGTDPDSADAQVPEPTEEITSAEEALESEEVAEAGDNVETFVDENC